MDCRYTAGSCGVQTCEEQVELCYMSSVGVLRASGTGRQMWSAHMLRKGVGCRCVRHR